MVSVGEREREKEVTTERAVYDTQATSQVVPFCLKSVVATRFDLAGVPKAESRRKQQKKRLFV